MNEESKSTSADLIMEQIKEQTGENPTAIQLAQANLAAELIDKQVNKSFNSVNELISGLTDVSE